MRAGYAGDIAQEKAQQLGTRHELPIEARDHLRIEGSRSILRCRGLSLGFWACGFEVEGIDHSADAVSTYSINLGKADCANLSNASGLPNADVIIAGPRASLGVGPASAWVSRTSGMDLLSRCRLCRRFDLSRW